MRWPVSMLLLLLLAGSRVAVAEPYLAVMAGLKCSACHVNPTGGGMRNTFGTVWGQTSLPARMLDMSGGPWTGELNRYFAVGADLRAGATAVDVPDAGTDWSFDINNLRMYLDMRVIPERLSVYVDERFAPGSTNTQEAYVRVWSKDHRWYAKVGQMYLPYGFRLQDDSAFIRETTSINFNTPDRGVEFGFDGARWTAQLAVSNGTAGGPEVDDGKQWSLRGEYVASRFRAGASFNFNDFDTGSKQMQNVFAGLKTGPVAWLAELDYIIFDNEGPDQKQWAGLLEANWSPRKGHNLKLTAELFDPDDQVSDDEQTRLSLVYEYTPIPFLQLRVGLRSNDDVHEVAFLNQGIAFVQVHGYL